MLSSPKGINDCGILVCARVVLVVIAFLKTIPPFSFIDIETSIVNIEKKKHKSSLVRDSVYVIYVLQTGY